MANKHELWELQSMQVAPLNAKIAMTKQRIRDWVNEFGVDGVYVSFSGGKDSTVLLTIAREMYPDIKAVFVDTGLEYPEIREFVKTWDNVDWLKPKMNFKQVIEKYGYPFISKEVSEAVWGARKYLTSLIESGMLDRPTDRPTDRPNQNLRINGGIRSTDKSQALANTLKPIRGLSIPKPHSQNSQNTLRLSGGGGHNTEAIPIRIHEADRDRYIWQAIQYCQKTGIGGGGTVRDFTNLTGVRTSKGSIEPRLWKNYSQFASSTSDGDKQQTMDQSSDNEGEYP